MEMFWGPGVRMTPTTDDQPYIFDVFADRQDIKFLLRQVGAVCGAVLASVLLLFVLRRRTRPTVPSFLSFSFFIFLGLGYFILEITLMKLYQSFTGSHPIPSSSS